MKGDSWKRWIKFLQDKEKYQQLAIEAIVRFKDKKGQLLQDVIEHDIKAILFKRIIFLGQFKLEDGSPIHKSATELVLKATDLNTNEYYLDFSGNTVMENLLLGKINLEKLLKTSATLET